MLRSLPIGCARTQKLESFRADNILEEILEARLKDDKLDDKVIQEYQEILAKVGGHEPIH